MNNKKGFTMVELLVVLVIVAILAAVATPIYLANVQRSRASEAVGTMALIRQGLRDYQISGAGYFDIGTGASANGLITDPLPTNVTAGVPSPSKSGVNIQPGVSQYFANVAFKVDSTSPASARFTNPDPVDFLITAKGTTGAALGDNKQCATATDINCATKTSEVANYLLEMDNSGRTFISYDGGTAWEAY